MEEASKRRADAMGTSKLFCDHHYTVESLTMIDRNKEENERSIE